MPYCSPHGFVALWMSHRKTDYFELPQRKTCHASRTLFVLHKENWNFCTLSEAEKSLMRVLLSHSVSQCAVAKHDLFALARVCSEDKKRQLFGVYKVVSTYSPDGIRSSDA